MPGVIEASVENYIYSLIPARDPVQREQERYALKHKVPIIGPACGRLLYQLARTIKTRRVFEMGSAIGYSTLWLARAVGPKGRVFYTDSDPANAARAEDYLRRASMLERVRVLIGDAVQLLDSTAGEFDLIFNDVDKEYYPEVLGLVAARLRPGGLFITDNVLWSGRVTEAEPKEESTRAIQEFNSRLAALPEFFTTIVPLRDGLSISLKI